MTRKIQKALTIFVIGLLVSIAFAVIPSLEFNTINIKSPEVISEYNITKDNNTIHLTVTGRMLGQAIAFYTRDASIHVTCDGEDLYSFEGKSLFCKSPGSQWHLIEIPDSIDIIGKSLNIKIDYTYDYTVISNVNVIFGSYSCIVVHLIVEELADILANLLLIILSILLFVIFIIELKKRVHYLKTVYLALVNLSIVIWSSSDLFLFQFIVPSGVGRYFINYILLFIVPILIFRYIASKTRKLNSILLEITHTGLIFYLLVLQMSGKSEFTENLAVYVAMTGFELLTLLMYIILTKEVRDKQKVIPLLVIISFITANCLAIFFRWIPTTSFLLAKVGLMFYDVLIISDSVKVIARALNEVKTSKAYKEIAIRDKLTGIGNRYLFETTIEKLDVRDLSIVSMDLNYLKYYNDTEGHAKGDDLLMTAAYVMKQIFGEYVYRTGGDEFTAILHNKTKEQLQEYKDKLNQLCEENSSESLVLEIACGYSMYTDNDCSYNDIMKRADTAMYNHKRILKQNSSIKYVDDRL